MNKIKVLNKNNIIIDHYDRVEFYSYNIIESIYIKDSKIFLTSEKEKSRTTLKYLEEFKKIYK